MKLPINLKKQDYLTHILESQANIYKSWGLQFFWNISGIKSGPEVFNE